MLASTETAGRAREIYNAGLNSAGVKWRCSPVTLSANVRTKVPAYIRAFGFLGHLIIKSRDYCSMSILTSTGSYILLKCKLYINACNEIT